jgi:uncharacterized protein (DUF58 family)
MAIPGVSVDLPELVALRVRAAQLERVERHKSADKLSGLQSSPFRGRGMEYAESRPYAPGDDVRHIDWRVTARTGRTHTKLFQPERERITAIVYDASPAMAFGTRACFKSVQAARLAALMVWAAQAQGDRLAAVACGRMREVIPPLSARRGALRVLDALVRWQPATVVRGAPADAGPPASTLSGSLDALYRVLRPGSHVLLAIDPRSVDAAAERSLVRLRAHHDLAACVLADPLEIKPPPPARYRISDGLRRQTLALDDDGARADWLQHFARQHDDVLDRLRRCGVSARLSLTDEDPVHVLHELLRGQPLRSVAA